MPEGAVSARPRRTAGEDLGLVLGAAGVLGAFSALGDWIWARYIPDGAVVPGIVHGILAFLLLAVVLGYAAGSRRTLPRLLVTLPTAGLVIAAAFYPLARPLGYLGALLVTWIAMWVALALAQRWARGGTESVGRALARGALAALGSGLAFWTISGIWTGAQAEAGYFLRFLYWTWAFVPGFAALLWRQRPG